VFAERERASEQLTEATMRFVDYTGDWRASTPLTVITGFPGAGKTTVIRHFLEHSSQCRILAIVRDVEPLLAGNTARTRRAGGAIEWENGCQAIESDDATATLATLRREGRKVDHVIVEASGSRNPKRAGGYAYMPGYRPNGVIAIVDASTASSFEQEETFTTTIQPLLQSTDLVVLNKLDVAGQETTALVQRSIASWAPSARFLWCRSGRLAPPLVVGIASDEVMPDDPRVVAEWRPDYIPVRSERKTMMGEQCRSWCLVSTERADARQFRAWVSRLPTSIMRGDGVVFLREEPQHRHEFTLLGSRWTLERGTPWGNEVPATNITLVGVEARRTESEHRPTRAPSERKVRDAASHAVL
jgi:G3E family GTPase